MLLAVDELAYSTATVGTREQRREFNALLRDIVARGRACGIVTVLATQRPSADIVPTSLRDLIGFRLALRCNTAAASNTVLGEGSAGLGDDAATISPDARGVGLLRSESSPRTRS